MPTRDQIASYSERLNSVDPDGELQGHLEQRIAGTLFDDYPEQTFHQLASTFVMEAFDTFFEDGECISIDSLTSAREDAKVYLIQWKETLATPEEGSDEEEANQAGRDLCLVILSTLRPAYVILKETEKER